MVIVGTRLALYSGVTNVNQTQEAKMTKQAKKEYQARMDAIHSESLRIRNTGKCPVCGAGLRDNLSLAGWVQCEQYGSAGFRKDSSKASCEFQCFTA